jgi:hypothetical protein
MMAVAAIIKHGLLINMRQVIDRNRKKPIGRRFTLDKMRRSLQSSDGALENETKEHLRKTFDHYKPFKPRLATILLFALCPFAFIKNCCCQKK